MRRTFALGGCALLLACQSIPAISGDDNEMRLAAATARFLAEVPPSQIHETRAKPGIVDRAGDIHVRLDSYRFGHRVIGAELIKHELASGQIMPGPDVPALRFDDTPPRISDAQAIAAGVAALAGEKARVTNTKAELVYLRDHDTHRLVYRVVVDLDPLDTREQAWELTVDAASARVLDQRDMVRRLIPPPPKIRPLDADADTEHYGMEVINTAYVPDTGTGARFGYTLRDYARPSPPFYNMTLSFFDDSGQVVRAGTPFWATTNQWGNGQPMTFAALQKGGLSAVETEGSDTHFAVGMAWDLFSRVFGRKGPFGNGDSLYAVVFSPNTTAWVPGLQTLYVQAEAVCAATTTFVSIGHEVGHAFWGSVVTGNPNGGETEALDEADSDIFGKLTEFYGLDVVANGSGIGTLSPTGLPPLASNWTIQRCGQIYRLMNHPSLDGGLDAWDPVIAGGSLDAHRTAGPIDRMFYFLAQGVSSSSALGETSQYLDSLTGIGIPAAADVYYRGVAGFLPADSPTFAQLRAAMEQAATPPVGGLSNFTVKHAVQDAFAAVNVGAKANRDPPTIGAISRITQPGKIVIATVSDPLGVKSVEYDVPGAHWGTATADPWGITLPAGVAGGSYALTVCATDLEDNRGCALSNINVDTTPPTISVFAVTNPNVAANKIVHLVAKDDNFISNADIGLNGTTLWNQHFGSAAQNQLGLPSIDLTPTLATATLADGTYTLQAHVADSYSQTATASATFQVDKTPPNLCGFTSVPSVISNLGGTVNAHASDATSGIASIAFFIDATPLAALNLNLPGGAVFTDAAQFGFQNPGTHTLKVVCIDKFGLSTTGTASFIAKVPPLVNVSVVGQSAVPTHSVNLVLNARSAGGLASVFAALSCTQSGEHIVATPISGLPTTFTQNVTVGNLILNETCTAVFRATDAFNLQSLDQSTFTVVTPVTPPPPPTCNQVQNSGANEPESFIIHVGHPSGILAINRDTFEVPDELLLECTDGGTIGGFQWFTPGGCEGTEGPLTTNVAISCTTDRVTVFVAPNCNGDIDTLWNFSLSCIP